MTTNPETRSVFRASLGIGLILHLCLTAASLLLTPTIVALLSPSLDADALLEAPLRARESIRAFLPAVAVMSICWVFFADALTLAWLSALARGRDIGGALRDAIRVYPAALRALLLLGAVWLALLSICGLAAWAIHALFQKSVDVRLHDVPLVILVGVLFLGWMISLAWHDLMRARIVACGARVRPAALFAIRNLQSTLPAFFVLFVLGAAIAILTPALIGLHARAPWHAVVDLVVVQLAAILRLFIRGAWLSRCVQVAR